MVKQPVLRWSLAVVGAGLVFLSGFFIVIDTGAFTVNVLKRALPFAIGVGLIAFNYWLQTTNDAGRRIRLVSLASVLSAVLFAGFVWWILFLVSLEGSFPTEYDYIVLNASTIGVLTGSIVGYQYCRLREERERLDSLTDELQQTNSALRVKVERLDEFASIVSHDLRNPINVASGYLELVKEDIDAETHEKIDRALARAETITTEMLELARQGKTVTDPNTITLQDVAEDAWRGVTTDDVTLEIGDSGSFLADRNRLQQLLENVYRNAIEHGGPTITTVRVGMIDTTGFYIEDDGQGFSTDTPQELFGAGISSTAQGTGYGLAIVKSISDAHNWQITATTSESGGARFEITNVTTQSE